MDKNWSSDHDYPKQLRKELQHLHTVLQNRNNGYPLNVINQWFIEFRHEFQRKPNLLTVKTHLCAEEIFQDRRQQIFKTPEAKDRFPDFDLPTEDMSMDQMETRRLANGLQRIDAGLGAEFDMEFSVLPEQPGTQDTQQTEATEMELDEVDAARDQAAQHRPILVIPYIKGLSEKLQKIAREANCGT